MSDIKKLSFSDTLKEGINLGIKNIAAIIVNCLLGGLTCWIPYFGIGVIIGMTVGIPAKVSKGQEISMTEVFNPDYRKYMGEFFLTAGLMGVGIGVGFALFFIPGMVLSLAWSLSLLLVVDKGKNPTEAISLSNKCTYGNKANIFGIMLVVGLATGVVIAIFGAIAGAVPFVGVILILAFLLFMSCIQVGIQAAIYKNLTEGV